jgi:hypothetical protein
MKIGKYTIKAIRWPSQGYGWFPHKNGKGPTAMLNSSGARFGAGWIYKLGISVGSSGGILIDLLFGSIMISKESK